MNGVQSPPFELVTRFWDQYMQLVPRLKFLQRSFPNATVTSWYRSNARNISVGGAPRSQHLLAFAADWGSLDAQDRQQMVTLARAVGMTAIDEGDHVHVQMFPAGVIPARFFPRNISV